MLDKSMSRRKFLVGAGTLAGVASVAGLGLARNPSDAAAAPPSTPPWTYPSDPAKQPVPEELARRAYEVYYSSGCAEATWWPIIEFLAKDTATNGDTWGSLPRNLFKFGSGGVTGWGTICGTLNGSAAIIALTGAPGKITDEVMQYYAETPLPTNGIDKAVADNWTPTQPAPPSTVVVPAPKLNVPTSTAHSQLCHASLAQWTMTTSKTDGSADQKDRCAKACHDLVLKTTQLLNEYWAHNTLPLGTLDGSVLTCQPACHTSAKGKMACDSCHDNTPGHAVGK